jgi:hypothetical protein
LKPYLLRVGADSTYIGGGFHGRVFEDRSYIFIPIPEAHENLRLDKALKYRDYIWQNKSVIPYLPQKIWTENAPEQFIHNDPEFVTFTYGSPKYNSKGTLEKNYSGLCNIEHGDILAFYARFSSEAVVLEGLYFFAYFIVDCPITFGEPESLGEEKQALIRCNHHFIHHRSDQVVVVGLPDNCKVLNKAVLLSSKQSDIRGVSNYYPNSSLQRYLGPYDKAMNLSSLRNPLWDGAAFKQYLDFHGM